MLRQPKEATYKYDAFVSYSHAADTELAPVLQSHLQAFAKPFWRLRSLRIFRDDTTLTLTPHLWPDIRRALDDARFFVLLASPLAAQSRWVQQEVSHWITTRGSDTLLIVLTEGRIEWDDATNDFDWSLTNALPPVLKGAFKSEPKWEDVAALTNPADLTMQNPVLRKTVASLFSAISGRPLDEVIGDDVRQHRRTRMAIAATVAAAVIGGSAFGWRELENQRIREFEQQQFAQQREERIRSQSRYVAEQARNYTERGDTGLAMNLVLEDLEPDPSDHGSRPIIPEAHFALFGALHSNLERQILPAGAEVRTAAISTKGQVLVAADRAVLVFDPGTRRPRQRLPHGGGVTTAQFNADGSRILSASRDGRARIWTIGETQSVDLVHTDEVNIAAFDQTERRIATGSRDGTASVWDAALGTRTLQLKHEADVADLAWSLDGSMLYTVTRGALRAWNTATGAEVYQIKAPENARFKTVRVNRDGTRLATATERGAAYLWNASDGGAIATLAHGRSNIMAAVFSPTDDLVVTTGGDLRMAVWDSVRGIQVYGLIDHNNVVAGATFSSDGSRLMTWSWDRTARIYSACDGRELAVLHGHTQDMAVAAFSPDGCSVVTGAGDATARVWSLIDRPGQTVMTTQACTPAQPRLRGQRCKSQEDFAALRREYLDAAFSRDGQLVATAGYDRIARVFDAASGKLIASMPEQTQPIRSVAFDQEGRRLLAAQGDLFNPERPGTLRIWDWREGRELIAGGIPHSGAVLDAVPSPDGKRILTATGDGLAMILDATTGAEILRIETRPNRICQNRPCRLGGARWSPDGQRVATASFGYEACVWDVGDKTGVLKDPALCVKHDHVVYTATWNSRGTHILTASGDQTAAVWDARSGEALRRFYGDAYDFRTAEFFDGDRQIVTSHNDYSVRFWHAGIGRELARVQHRQSHLNSATIDATGRRLLTASSDGSARIWQLPETLEALTETAKSTLQRCLSIRQREEFNLNTRPLPEWCAGKLHGPSLAPRPTNEAAAGR